MTKNDILEDVQRILAKVLPVQPEECRLPARLGEDLECDSLDRFEIVLELEMLFEIDLDDDCVEAWHTVRDMVDSVYRMTQSPSPAQVAS